MSPTRRLLGYVRPYWALLGTCLGAAVIASTLDGLSFAMLIPFFRALFQAGTPGSPVGVERMLDRLLHAILGPGTGAGVLRGVALILLVTILVKNFAAFTANHLGGRLQEYLARDLRRALYGHLQRLGLGFYHKARGGELLNRMLSDPEQAKLIVSNALVTALQNAVVVLVYLAIMFSISWRLALVALLVAPAIAGIMLPLLRRLRSRIRATLEQRGELAAIVAETVEGARLVKAHAAEPYERRRFDERMGNYVREVTVATRLSVMAHPLSESLGGAVIVLLLAVGTGTAVGPALRPELFLAFLAVTLRLLPPIKALAQFPVYAAQATASAERLFEILDLPPDDVDQPSARPFAGLKREIVFDDVWFGYRPGEWVLAGVQLRVGRGEVVAIVGPSGAGKSTLVDLLPRFIDPTRGAVTLDGVPTTAYGRQSLRRQLGIVSQQTVIFNDTVRANIAYGDQASAGLPAIEAAARAANAHAFIERLPLGYDTPLGERGARLSGGERQRIAIARAILRDPPVLILDEATSALDSESERLVQEAIEHLMHGRTVLVIAHRLSTISRADRIAVLDRGVIMEQGSHDQLVTSGGVYQRLHSFELVGR
ncbi:MAG: ABC transporter ATP-binding protein [Gemmatimonadetes bacterium]|nr:ABC transporter ATP-binding protein [Gemmatimonadota bacterium]